MLTETTPGEELWTILQQERAIYSIQLDYLAFATEANHDPLTEGCRLQVCGWFFEVVDHFQYDRDVAALAIYYLDQCTAIKTKTKGPGVTRHEYQLISLTSLYLAIKLYGRLDHSPLRPTIESFVNLSNGKFSIEDIEDKEIEMLQLLNWHVNPSSALRIGISLINFIPQEWEGEGISARNHIKLIFEVSRYLSELSLHSAEISLKYRASEIAFASVLCAMNILKRRMILPDWVKTEFIRNVSEVANLSTSKSVPTICTALQDIFQSAPSKFGIEHQCILSGKESPVSVQDF